MMKGLKLDPVRHLAVPAALLAMIAFNVLAVTLPLGGRATQEVSALYENLLTPAGYAFSIWSLIYAGLTAFTLYQFLPSQAGDRVAGRVSVLFVISCLLNLSWLISWHFLWIGFSTVLMVALLAVLVLIYFQVTSRRVDRTLAHRLMVALPFRIYLGWIVVATLANFGALAVQQGWGPALTGETGWVFAAMAAAAVAALLALVFKRDLFLTLTVIWGLVAISFGPQSTGVTRTVGLVTAGLLLVLAVLLFLRSRGRGPGNDGATVPVPQRPLTPAAAHEEFIER